MTSLELGGAADAFVTIGNVEDARNAVRFARSERLPIWVLGGGSNVVIADDGELLELGEYCGHMREDAEATEGIVNIQGLASEEPGGEPLWRLRVRRVATGLVFERRDREGDWRQLAEAEAAGLTNLKGHRSVGGMRASIYNAMPMAGVEKLADFLQNFQKHNS